MSGIVLVFVFILTLTFGVLRIVNTAPSRLLTTTEAPAVLVNQDESVGDVTATITNTYKPQSDRYALAEDVTKLIFELVSILLAILATFALFRYVKAKYAAVPTRE